MELKILDMLTLEQKKVIYDVYISRPVSRADLAEEWGLSVYAMNEITHCTDYGNLW